MSWKCKVCETQDVSKRIIHNPPICCDCLDTVDERKEPPALQDLFDNIFINVQPKEDLSCLFKMTAPYAR